MRHAAAAAALPRLALYIRSFALPRTPRLPVGHSLLTIPFTHTLLHAHVQVSVWVRPSSSSRRTFHAHDLPTLSPPLYFHLVRQSVTPSCPSRSHLHLCHHPRIRTHTHTTDARTHTCTLTPRTISPPSASLMHGWPPYEYSHSPPAPPFAPLHSCYRFHVPPAGYNGDLSPPLVTIPSTSLRS